MFAEYRERTLPLVGLPPSDQIRRRVVRRTRIRAATAVVLVVVTIGVLAGRHALWAAPRTPTDQDRPFGSRSTASAALVPLSTAAHDLVIHGPDSVTLRPTGSRYLTTMTITATNVGWLRYDFGALRLRLPAIITIDKSEGVGTCVPASPPDMPPDMRQWDCVSDVSVIPARGGRTTFTIGLAADHAVLDEDVQLSAASINIVAWASGNAATHYDPVQITDATPANNQLPVLLVLTRWWRPDR